jgi:hypothetical protein
MTCRVSDTRYGGGEPAGYRPGLSVDPAGFEREPVPGFLPRSNPADNSHCIGGSLPGFPTDARGLCRVCLAPVAFDSEYCGWRCRRVERDCQWAMVKDRAVRDTAAGRWAKVRLGLVEPGDDLPPATTPRVGGHTCGGMQVDGVWQCVQDFYAVGWAPQTSCGRTRP